MAVCNDSCSHAVAEPLDSSYEWWSTSAISPGKSHVSYTKAETLWPFAACYPLPSTFSASSCFLTRNLAYMIRAEQEESDFFWRIPMSNQLIT